MAPGTEVVARVLELMAFATNDNAALGGGVRRCSVVLVAGTRTERCHTPAVIEI